MNPRQVFGASQESHLERTRARFCLRCGNPMVQKLTYGLDRSVCPACSYVHYVNPLPGVSVLVAQDNSVLLVKRGPSHSYPDLWCLPCGAVEFQEDFLTAAIREVKEESGIDVRITGLISAVSNFFVGGASTLVIVLAAEPVGSAPQADGDESIEVGWFDPDVLPPLAFEADEHIIQRYFATDLPGAPVDPDYQQLV